METYRRGLKPGWATLILLIVIVSLVLLVAGLFAGTFRSFTAVTLTSDRAGLVMDPGGKVKLRGVEVGRVADITADDGSVRLQLDIYPDQVQFIPANIDARIRASTAFGAKYVDLLYPRDPSTARIKAGQDITSLNVSTEVNTTFQNLSNLLGKVDPAKLNSVLSALAEGLRGHGPAIGEAVSAANETLSQLNPRAEVIRNDWKSLKGFGDTYGAAAQDIIKVLDAATTTSKTISDNAASLDQLLLSVIGLSKSGIDTIAPSKDALVTGINALEPTTNLLLKYSPELTCTLTGAYKLVLPESQGGYGLADANGGRDGKSEILDVALLLGDDAYRYPDNLPIVGAKGGPGGRPSCGSLPDVSQNYPNRYLVTNTGWGTGMDVRPNPGIGFPGYADYLPTTRGTPHAPSIRHPGGPAPGPIPYPGAPPYGAPLYAPDGTPLYPGLPTAPAPGAPRDPGPTPGSEPFVVTNPMELPPTPTAPIPTPAQPSP